MIFQIQRIFVLLGYITKNANLIIKNISLNPTRIGLFELLKSMGAKIRIEETGASNGELFGNINVMSSELNNVNVSEEIIPSIIDEIPILAVAGLFAEGDFEIRNAQELTSKRIG